MKLLVSRHLPTTYILTLSIRYPFFVVTMIRQSFNDRTRIVNFFCRMIPNKSRDQKTTTKVVSIIKSGISFSLRVTYLFIAKACDRCVEQKTDLTKDQLCAHLFRKKHG